MIERLDQKESSDAFVRTKLMDLLDEGQEKKRRDMEEKQKLLGMSTQISLPSAAYQSPLIKL